VKIHGITNDVSKQKVDIVPKFHEKEPIIPDQINGSAEVSVSPGTNDTFFLPGKILDVSMKSQVNVKQEILQQNFENVLSSDKILNSANVDSNVQKDILVQLSSLEPVALEKPEELNRKSTNFQEKVVKIPDQTNTPIDTNISKYYCKYCDKKFTHSGSAKTHERIHTGEKPYGCSYCEKKFTRSTIAKAHERTHTGEKPYGCKYCEMKFTVSQSAKKHERTHTGEKPYSCRYCEMKFTVSQSAKKHERTHTGEKPYGCKYCEMKFTALQSAKSHERSHTGEKPYACKYCDKKFSHLSSLKAHETIHTGENSFYCKNCDFKAATQTSLNKHESTHNQESIDNISMHGLSNSVLERSNP
jgi:uncharacterized Zn-finger protein